MTPPTVAAIEAMDRTALVAAWRGLFGGPPPKSLSRPFLRRFLAFEVQARRRGGLPKRCAAELDRRAAGRPAAATPALKRGARLIREWNGATHVVEAVEGGWLWNGERHRSLSAVARAITGARWSGPRFFGVAGGGR